MATETTTSGSIRRGCTEAVLSLVVIGAAYWVAFLGLDQLAASVVAVTSAP